MSSALTQQLPDLVIGADPATDAEQSPSVQALRSRFGKAIRGVRLDPVGTPVVTG